MELRQISIGDAVVFIDSVGRVSNALVTNVFGETRLGRLYGAEVDTVFYPCINFVTVADDENKTDPYGRQLSRHTSMVHRSANQAGRFCWIFPDETK